MLKLRLIACALVAREIADLKRAIDALAQR